MPAPPEPEVEPEVRSLLSSDLAAGPVYILAVEPLKNVVVTAELTMVRIDCAYCTVSAVSDAM